MMFPVPNHKERNEEAFAATFLFLIVGQQLLNNVGAGILDSVIAVHRNLGPGIIEVKPVLEMHPTYTKQFISSIWTAKQQAWLSYKFYYRPVEKFQERCTQFCFRRFSLSLRLYGKMSVFWASMVFVSPSSIKLQKPNSDEHEF